ncbi:MAG: DNA translocase FtsK 4TM domain-containing protein [Bacteroidota bacterium]
MAKSTKSSSKKTKKSTKTPSGFEPEKEESIDLRSIIRDERTWKIVGVSMVFFSLFLLVAFISYLSNWQSDSSVVSTGLSALFNSQSVQNAAGVLGALTASFFFESCFGFASFLICTFFFVVGVNLLFRRRVFSIWRNVKYVTIGMLVASVVLSYLFPASKPFGGGAVGLMINQNLDQAIGKIGTGAVLFLSLGGYLIWQFNPSLQWPFAKKETDVESAPETIEEEPVEEDEQTATSGALATAGGMTVNDMYGNSIAGEEGSTGPVVVQFPIEEEASDEMTLIEKEPELSENDLDKAAVTETAPVDLTPAVSVTLPIDTTTGMQEVITTGQTVLSDEEGDDLALEIKTVPEEPVEESPALSKEEMAPYEPTLDLRDYKYPTLDLLEQHGSEKIIQDNTELENNKNQIISTLRNYSIEIQKISATVGPTVTLYEIVPAAGVRISKIKNLEDDIALSLAALGIRIIAPIPGKGTIGIEVPNVKKTVVSMKTLLSSDRFQNSPHSLPIAIGKRIDNENFIVDLAAMPHLLMAGATGQGKSVGLNAILVSLLYKKHPSQLKFVLIDPKKVELSIYRHIERHFLAKLPGEEDAIITDTKKVVYTLNALCIEMDNRYDLLKEAGARNIKEYNEKFIKRKLNPQKGHQYLPFIVLVVDEFADLIMTAGKEVEMPIARLAQLARAIGIHLIIATQRPSVNIITGTIKANFPARIAFKVSSKIDSRTILDTGGAEQLIGKGDMLISYNGELTRLQCAFVDTPEVEQVVECIGDQRGYPQAFLLPEYVDEKDAEGWDFDMSEKDPLFEDAARLIVQNQMGSTSLLQRRMKLGYNRAGRLMDQLESAGIVGPSQGSKAREVLIKTDADLQQHLDQMG